MINNLTNIRKMWGIVATLSLFASVAGIFNQNIYRTVASQNVLPGIISQDLITIFISLGLLLFAIKITQKELKKQIISLSFLAYLFYAYGIYVIEQLYNSFYILYIAIFALSFWALVYSLSCIDIDKIKNIKLSKLTRYLTIGFLIFIPLLFYLLWIGQLLPLMSSGDRIEYRFSIYILDMAFVLPALIISAILVIKKKALGYIFAPILFFKAFTLLFSVGLGGILLPLYDLKTNSGENVFYFILAIVFLVLAIMNYRELTFKQDTIS